VNSAGLTPAGTGEPAVGITSELLDTEVVELMTPGCVTISEEASVGQAAQALATHRSHAVLVVGTTNGTPLGWVTARGLLGWLGRDRSLVSAREAITERVTAIHPDEPVSTARQALSNPGVTHLRGPPRPPTCCPKP
jgi:CBS domain-containing protein